MMKPELVVSPVSSELSDDAVRISKEVSLTIGEYRVKPAPQQNKFGISSFSHAASKQIYYTPHIGSNVNYAMESPGVAMTA